MISLIFVLSQHLTAQAQPPKPPTRAELTRFSTTLDSLRQRLEIPGLSAAIVYHDSVYGRADAV